MGRSRLWKDRTKPSSPNENFEERVVRRAGTARHHGPRVAMPAAPRQHERQQDIPILLHTHAAPTTKALQPSASEVATES